SAHLGRTISMQRRRQLSQGKQALTGDGAPVAAVQPALQHGRVAEQQESLNVDAAAASGRELARARRAVASRLGSAGIDRRQREGRVTYPPKVIVSPTHRDQRVTGLRIGPGVQVTGDEPGAALPVTGTQYVPADGSAPAPGVGPKVGHVRTPHGLVVSGTTVRSKVRITGDEAGEHLRITGEADQKFDDDLTPRTDGGYRSTQFPRRADPHGATSVTLQPQLAASKGDGPGQALAATDGGLPVTGTAVGRSGRVTGNEAGVCRPITGDQYQDPAYYSSECGGIGGGTAPAAHLNRSRLDPATGGKVTVAQTWGGQRVTGPSVEYRPNVTGDEPGSCRPLTGTPYQGPTTAFGWCEPDEGDSAAQRLDRRPEGLAVTGDLPMHVENVTGTERGYRNDITGSSYYGEMRPAEPAGDDAATWQGFSVPVAQARRLAGRENDNGAKQRAENAPPVSNVPGGITGSFAIGDGMVTGNNEFLFRPRLNRDARAPVAVTGEGETEGRTITGSPAAWKPHDKVTGTEGYIAAGRNPSEGGSGPNGFWAGARRFKNLATPGWPGEGAKVTGRVGGSPKDAARVTVSGGAQG
ncbi:MAG: CsoS2 family carboxysome shell protein, partial [Actinomycetota bacterium]|nr:CsoS2 family carboxysome shell protein [Actinomycetota bacterium]